MTGMMGGRRNRDPLSSLLALITDPKAFEHVIKEHNAAADKHTEAADRHHELKAKFKKECDAFEAKRQKDQKALDVRASELTDWATQLGNKESALLDREKNLREFQAQLEDQKKAIAEASVALEKRAKDVRAEADEIIAKATAHGKKIDDELHARKINLDDYHFRIKDREAAVEVVEKKLAEEEVDLAKRKKELAANEAEHNRKVEALKKHISVL